MKRRLVLFVGLLFSLSVAAQQKSPNPIAGKWILEKLFTVKEQPSWIQKPELVFQVKDNTLSGFDGCNILMGKFKQSDNKTLRLLSITGTLKACPDNNADQFLNTLDQIDHYRIRNGKLELLHGNQILLRLSRK